MEDMMKPQVITAFLTQQSQVQIGQNSLEEHPLSRLSVQGQSLQKHSMKIVQC